MLIAPAVLAAIISAVGSLGAASANANKPPQTGPPQPPPMMPDQMTGGGSKAALAAGQKPLKVADAFPQAPVGGEPQPGPGGLPGMDPKIMELLKMMGGF